MRWAQAHQPCNDSCKCLGCHNTSHDHANRQPPVAAIATAATAASADVSAAAEAYPLLAVSTQTASMPTASEGALAEAALARRAEEEEEEEEEAAAVTAREQVAHHLGLMRIATATGRVATASGEAPLLRGLLEDDDDEDCIEAIERLGRLEVQCRSGPPLLLHWPERSRCDCGWAGIHLRTREALCGWM
jgi:hypothetical protein